MNMYVFWVWMVIAPHLWALLWSSPGPSRPRSPSPRQWLVSAPGAPRLQRWHLPHLSACSMWKHLEWATRNYNWYVPVHEQVLLRGASLYWPGHEINNFILKFCQLKRDHLRVFIYVKHFMAKVLQQKKTFASLIWWRRCFLLALNSNEALIVFRFTAGIIIQVLARVWTSD